MGCNVVSPDQYHRAASLAVPVEGFSVALRLGDPPSYRLILETAEHDKRVLAGLLARFEKELRSRNLEYATKRDSQRLGDPVLCLLPAGFFEGDRRRHAATGAPDGQYKFPHVVPDMGRFDKARPVAEVAMPGYG